MEQSAPIGNSPAQRRRLKMRQTILAAADRVFSRDGRAGLSIRRLAEEIDYSPGAIYKYFDSKQALVDELKEMFFERLLEDLPVFDGKPEDYLAFARSGFETYMKVALEAPHHYEAAFSGASEAMPVALDLDASTAKARAFASLFDLIQTGMDLGIFEERGDVADVAKSVWAACHGFIVLMIGIPNFPGAFRCEAEQMATPEMAIARHADFLVRGLMA